MPAKKAEVTTEDPWDSDKDEAPSWSPEKENNVSDVRDFMTVTWKAGPGYEAPWVVFHFSSLEEALDVMEDDLTDEVKALVLKHARDFQEEYKPAAAKPAARASSGGSSGGWGNKSSSNNSRGSYNRDSNKPKVQFDEDAGYGCEHGEANRVTGEKNGRQWVRWDCPDRECESVFENNRRR